MLFVVYLLTPTSNHNWHFLFSLIHPLYIFWLLHQTTTIAMRIISMSSCISFDSYIKPQPSSSNMAMSIVVYLLTPTSNHNAFCLLIVWSKLYIFWLLHQTTTLEVFSLSNVGCISFDSYIKPQPSAIAIGICSVVYLLTPTSNHNLCSITLILVLVVYLLTPTSNHNSTA